MRDQLSREPAAATATACGTRGKDDVFSQDGGGNTRGKGGVFSQDGGGNTRGKGAV